MSEAHGLTRRFIEQDGFEIVGVVNYLQPGTQAIDVVASASRALGLFAQALHTVRPDVVMLLGDRYETLCAAMAAVSLGLPVGHIHGGEVTEGALDESYRHAVTKLAHVHFAASHDAARRIVQLGEQPERVHVCGAPGLEAIAQTPELPIEAVGEALGVTLRPGFLLVTYHPETISSLTPALQVDQLTAALSAFDRDIVITGPNVDTGGNEVAERLRAFCRQWPAATYAVSAGQEVYVNLMRHAAAMVGNSSSGIIEAPSVGLPVVNVGDRQRGRPRAANVIDVPCDVDSIARGISEALSGRFRDHLIDLANPYGDGRTSHRIVQVLTQLQLDGSLLRKPFYDLRGVESSKA